MKVSDFDYYLPEELIAQHPIAQRDSSRMLVYHRKDGRREHRKFSNIKEYLKPGDCLVINDTRVLPARLYGCREDTGGKIELLLLKDMGENRWETLVKPGRRAKIGMELNFGNGLLKAKVLDILEDGLRLIEFEYKGIFNEILEEIGVMPLPPYIHETLREKERYQTIYNKHIGSSAAPTAGLHFTNELLDNIENMGVRLARITLHVGLATFRPIKVKNIHDHKMHLERYIVSEKAANTINQCRQNGGRIIAVGTTSVRTLESITDEKGMVYPKSGETDIFIFPGYDFKAVDGIITNFHLPKSTLIMLVGAFMGEEEVLKVYQEAIEEKYRFFSFGDSMLII